LFGVFPRSNETVPRQFSNYILGEKNHKSCHKQHRHFEGDCERVSMLLYAEVTQESRRFILSNVRSLVVFVAQFL
jgi:hypothetical protein